MPIISAVILSLVWARLCGFKSTLRFNKRCLFRSQKPSFVCKTWPLTLTIWQSLRTKLFLRLEFSLSGPKKKTTTCFRKSLWRWIWVFKAMSGKGTQSWTYSRMLVGYRAYCSASLQLWSRLQTTSTSKPTWPHVSSSWASLQILKSNHQPILQLTRSKCDASQTFVTYWETTAAHACPVAKPQNSEHLNEP